MKELKEYFTCPNGSELKVISSDLSARPTKILICYRKYPTEFIKDCFPDIWNNLHWYQKVYYKIYFKWIRKIYR